MQSAHLARTIRAKIAQALNRDESAMDFDASFDALGHEIHEVLDVLVQEIFGRPFYRWEFDYLPQGFEKPDSINRLTSYLIKDIETQAPETGFSALRECLKNRSTFSSCAIRMRSSNRLCVCAFIG